MGHAPDLLSQHLWGWGRGGAGICAPLDLQVFLMLANDGEPQSAGLLRIPESPCPFPAVGHGPACPSDLSPAWLASPGHWSCHLCGTGLVNSTLCLL